MAGMFSSGTDLPAIKEPAPLPDDKATARAARAKVAERQSTQGRQSTLLTSGGREKLGAG